ncbi:MAG: hypothetical protein ACREFX_01275 [Opitutaceae bacterium]
MKRIEVKLSLPVVAPLLDLVKELGDDLKRLPVGSAALAQVDPDLAPTWAAELLSSQAEDVKVLLALFGEDFFADGVVCFDPGNAEAIARACSAVRLRLRERYLQPLGDEALEAGDVDLQKLPEPVRKAFMCYLFLATIQELIIQHLDESIIGG